MLPGETAQTWIEKGAEAYANMRVAEAAQHFEKAVEVDPHSVKAQLSLGVFYLFQYQNGLAEQVDRMDDASSGPRRLTREEIDAKAEKRRAQIAQQNATNAPRAEEHLKQAVQLDPRYEPAMEYLAALYLWWRDPASDIWDLWARRDDARCWYARIVEHNPQHRCAHYACGVIDYQKAFVLIRSTTPGFPRPLADKKARRSLRAKVGPLLEDSAASFLRSLEIDPNNSGAMTYLGFVKSDEAYIAENMDDSAQLRAEAADWYRKVDQIRAAHAKATGQPWPPGNTGAITFKRIPGKPPIPSFPPDAQFMMPPAPPSPPPLPPGFKR
jgi:tetratricopeptide (TPR) repeat protein